jgi:hypothetical protein
MGSNMTVEENWDGKGSHRVVFHSDLAKSQISGTSSFSLKSEGLKPGKYCGIAVSMPGGDASPPEPVGRQPGARSRAPAHPHSGALKFEGVNVPGPSRPSFVDT